MIRRRFPTGALRAALAGLSAAAAGSAGAQDAGIAPDLIVHNAKIVTVDRAFSIAEAAAIKDGAFVAVGSDAQLLAAAGEGTRVVDLGGRTVLPGLHDTHRHLVKRGVRLPGMVDLAGVTSIAEIKRRLAAAAETAEDGAWLFGSRGWWERHVAEGLEEGRLPTREDLDAAVPGRPAVLPGSKYYIINSAALAALGIDETTPDPEGGEIGRDGGGRPTGFLLDAARAPVDAQFPEIGREQKLNGIRRMIAQANRFGLTSYREPGGTPEQVALLRALHRRGELTIRVDWAYDVDPATPPEALDAVFDALGPPGQRWGDGLFRADSLSELFLDGGERTAHLRTAYPGRPGYHGLETVSQETFERFALAAARRGWRLSPHAVGDGAIDKALAAFRYAHARVPIAGRRWMIDHAVLLLPDHYAAVKELELIVNAQYRLLYLLGDRFAEAWGRPLAEAAYRFRDWRANGIRVTNGADRPISDYSRPMLQIYGAITRQVAGYGRLGADQALSRAPAIRMMTRDAAYTAFEEHRKGSIEPGKYADFVVLSHDILTVAPERIKDIGILATVLGGRTVYGRLAP